MDLIARHYSLRTANTIIHSTSPMRFTDGQGHAWLFLILSHGNLSDSAEVVEALGIISQHCLSPKWSINLDAAEVVLQSIIASPVLASLVDNKTAMVDWLDIMVLDPSERSESGIQIVREMEVHDGREWFVGKYPILAQLVEWEDVWMVQDGQEVGGYIVALPDPKTGRVYISDLLVFPEYRRKGLGRALLHHVISRAKDSGWQVCLTVFCSNEGARHMYVSEGFKVERKLVVAQSA